MTPNTQALQRLLEAVDGSAISTDMIIEAFGNGWDDVLVLAAFDGSLDAAKALHEALLPGWINRMNLCGQGAGVSVCHVELSDWETDFAICVDNAPVDNPARAWLLAIIRAVMAGER